MLRGGGCTTYRRRPGRDRRHANEHHCAHTHDHQFPTHLYREWANVPSATIGAGVAPIRWLCFVAGVTAIVLGSLARQWAISTLGRFFTLNVTISDEQRVVTSGPYRWVRHPSYTADLLAFTGIGLALGNWLALLAAAVLPLIGLLVRIRVEEKALFAKLGEPYRAYAQDRKRLVPLVW